MDEHKPIYISDEKRAALTVELEERKTKTRMDISERLIAARELGDLKENAEYHVARDEQGKNESRIREIEEILKRAKTLEKIDGDIVSLGMTVTIQKKGSDAKRVFTVVDAQELDSSGTKISGDSPLGSALLGSKKGATVSVAGPSGIIEYSIISFE